MRDALGSVQSVLLLGGTSEIGLATVRALVADRVRTVVLAVRDPAGAEAPAAELRARGAEVDVVTFDAARPETHAAVLGDVFARHPDLDVALVAFGVLGPGGDEQLGHASALHAVNDAGAVSAMAVVAERMGRQGHGTLVLLSSVAAERPRVSNYAYGSSKAGADAFARGLGDALHGTGVAVVVVRPGFVRTKMTAGLEEPPLTVDAETVARAVIAAIRRPRPVVWVPASMRAVMTVLRLLPRPVFRRLPL